MPDLKLGSNWKSCGYHTDMRRFAHGNPRINFSFCKGDDNYGGIQRKELDDFCKSLGKTMNLVLYRMQDTENLRTKLREKRRQEEREEAASKEKRDVAWFERIEKNRRRRTTSEAETSLPCIPEAGGKEMRSCRQGARTLEMGLEERRRKNMAWREARGGQEDQHGLAVWRRLQAELVCVSCQEEIGDMDCVEVYQCEGRHSLCAGCCQEDGGQSCPVCPGHLWGPHSTLGQVLLLLQGRRQTGRGRQEDPCCTAKDSEGPEAAEKTGEYEELDEEESAASGVTGLSGVTEVTEIVNCVEE